MESEEYRKLADVEDHMWYFRALHGHIERELSRSAGDSAAKVLDAGCGTGGLIRRLAPKHPAWRWTGLDASELACGYARPRLAGTGVEVVCGRVESLPFPDAAFDVVVSADVLYHLDEDTAALREFARVLRPGGAVILNVPAHPWLWSYHDVAVHGRRRYTRRDLRAKLAGTGYQVVRLTHWNSLPLPLVVIRRKLLPPPAGGSDVCEYPAVVERSFDAAMAMERGWLRVFGRIPFGSSILAVARKS